MPNITYVKDIPVATNNPSVDQPNMTINTNAIDQILNVDHYGFNLANGGYHQQVTITQSGALPSTAAANLGVLYNKLNGGESQLFYSPDASSDEYQMSRCITGDFATFSTNTAYQANHTGGWSFLPGGMMIQYGVRSSPGTSGSVTFPVAFTGTVYSVVLTGSIASATVDLSLSSGTPPTNAGFTYLASSASIVNFHWMAIGV